MLCSEPHLLKDCTQASLKAEKILRLVRTHSRRGMTSVSNALKCLYRSTGQQLMRIWGMLAHPMETTECERPGHIQPMLNLTF